MDSSGMGFLHHTEGAMRLRADFGRGNLSLSPGFQPDIDVRDDVTRLAPLRPTLVLAVAAPFTPFFQPAQDHALALRGREDPHDLIVAAPRPDDPVRARALHAIYRPAPRDQSQIYLCVRATIRSAGSPPAGNVIVTPPAPCITCSTFPSGQLIARHRPG